MVLWIKIEGTGNYIFFLSFQQYKNAFFSFQQYKNANIAAHGQWGRTVFNLVTEHTSIF